MKIEQVYAAAEAQLPYLSDLSCIKIFGSSATDSKTDRIFSLLQSAIDQENLRAKIVRTGSFGYFDLEPIVRVEKPGREAILYTNVTLDGVADLMNDLAKGTSGVPFISELPSFNLQKRIALRNCGWIDPEDINHYILHGKGYAGFSRALSMNPSDLKWKQFPLAENVYKYLICNAIDPDPRSLTCRLLLESDPHSVLEGMLIGAYAAGASHGIILVEEKSEAFRRLRKALDQMRAYNLLGSNILDSQFCSEIKIIEEPTTLTTGHRMERLRCIEENQPQLHMLPVYPADSEFMGKPVLIVNPEMMSNLAAGCCDSTKGSRKSKVVTLSGSAIHKYTVEVSPETTIRSVLENFGGGVSNGKKIKAVQLGGPLGSFIALNDLNLPVGSDEVGPGSIEVLDADSGIVDATKNVMAYIQSQSCGKCVFCREGCLQMLTILEDISENKGKPQDLDLLVELGEEMRASCLCAFGRTAPNPVLSSIKLFRNEYERVPGSEFPVEGFLAGNPEP
jgi:NADH-quinone oxidoreductase subunit F